MDLSEGRLIEHLKYYNNYSSNFVPQKLDLQVTQLKPYELRCIINSIPPT